MKRNLNKATLIVCYLVCLGAMVYGAVSGHDGTFQGGLSTGIGIMIGQNLTMGRRS